MDAALVSEAVRDRDRRVMQDEATVETEGRAGSQREGGKRSRQLKSGVLGCRQELHMGPGVNELDLTDGGKPRNSPEVVPARPPWPSLLLCDNLLSS